MWRKLFRWRVQHCRLSLRKDAGFAFFFWVCLHCCILLFLPDATPCASFFNRGSHSKPAEKRKTSTQKFTVWEWRLATLRSVIWKGCRICILPWVTLYCCILSFLPRQFARKCPVSHSFSEGRQVPRLTESRAVTPDLKHEKSSGSFLRRISWRCIRKHYFGLFQTYIVLISSRKKGVLIEG